MIIGQQLKDAEGGDKVSQQPHKTAVQAPALAPERVIVKGAGDGDKNRITGKEADVGDKKLKTDTSSEAEVLVMDEGEINNASLVQKTQSESKRPVTLTLTLTSTLNPYLTPTSTLTLTEPYTNANRTLGPDP